MNWYVVATQVAHWPPIALTLDTRTITFSLAIDATTEENGCINFVKHPDEQSRKTLRPFRALYSGDRDEDHAVVSETYEGNVIVPTPVKRGSVSLHDEYVVHGSNDNGSGGDRRTYVLAFRPQSAKHGSH